MSKHSGYGMSLRSMPGALALLGAALIAGQVWGAEAGAPSAPVTAAATRTLAGGTQVVDTAIGSGDQANTRAAVAYRFLMGTISDVSLRDLAVTRTDSDPSVSRSISEALPGMRVGGKRRVTTPPIAGQPTTFELELLDVASTASGLKARTDYMTAAEKAPKGPDPAIFFQGCQVIRGEPGRTTDQIRGSCIGHRFSDEGLALPTPCQVRFTASVSLWGVFNCNMDGRLIGTANFRSVKAELFDIQYLRADTAGVTRRELLGPGSGPPPTLHPLNPVTVATGTPPPELASAPGVTVSFEDKQFCDGQVQKHLRQGGIPSGVGYVFSTCIKERVGTRQTSLAREEQARKTDLLKAQRLQTEAQLCPAGARPPSAADVTESTLYGLAINMPAPCLKFCPDTGSQSTRMCVDSISMGKTAWSTVRFRVLPSTDVFGLDQIWATGVPVVEVADGRIVGVTFEGGFYTPQTWLQVLTRKLGKYQTRGAAFMWETPLSSARLVPTTATSYSATGSVDLDHPFGEGIEGRTHDEATFSIYVPAVRARREAYEAADAQKNAKEEF
jgi:hypothetical protein